MSQVDQFESVFRSAVKDIFIYQSVMPKKILLITDLNEADISHFEKKIHAFIEQPEAHWNLIGQEDYHSTEALLNIVAAESYDLLITYRNLKTQAWQYPHSLGAMLDVLLQRTPIPVLIVPHPKADYALEHALQSTKIVMAITDHLSNDHNLVNYASQYTASGGHLLLTHIEDQAVFDYYSDAISKIPSIITEEAIQKLKQQLLKKPLDYITSCRKILATERSDITLKAIVQFGHHLSEYKKYIESEQVDLLVMYSKDEDQLAMHGLAYPLAVEFRQIPLLML